MALNPDGTQSTDGGAAAPGLTDPTTGGATGPGATGGGAPWGAIIPGIAAVGGGIAGYMGQQSANDANSANQMQMEQFQADEAQKARNWQALTSSTGYQRTMWDLKKAGLNPMLAYQSGPEGMSGSAQAGSVGQATMENSMAAGVSSAGKAAQTVTDIMNSDSQRTLNNAQALFQVAAADRQTTAAHLDEENTLSATIRNKKDRSTMGSDIKTRLNQNQLDLQNSARERLLNQIKTGTGIVTDAVGGAARAGAMLEGGAAQGPGGADYSSAPNAGPNAYDGEVTMGYNAAQARANSAAYWSKYR